MVCHIITPSSQANLPESPTTGDAARPVLACPVGTVIASMKTVCCAWPTRVSAKRAVPNRVSRPLCHSGQLHIRLRREKTVLLEEVPDTERNLHHRGRLVGFADS
jgi:hypothetical protein